MKNISIYADKKQTPARSVDQKQSLYPQDYTVQDQEIYWWQSHEEIEKKLSMIDKIAQEHQEFVHRNSREPEKFGVKAFTKNGEIYLSPGSEDYFDHELAHIYQQKTKNIPITAEIGGQKVNLDPKLEKEADEIARHIESYIPDIVANGTNKIQDIIQFDYDPKNPGQSQEQRRDYYKKPLAIDHPVEGRVVMYPSMDRSANFEYDIALVDRCTSVEQISARLKVILASYWRDTPKDHIVDLGAMDLNLAKANAKQLIYLFSKYSTSIHDINMEMLEPGDERYGARASVSGEFVPLGGRTLSFHNPFFVANSETIGSAVLQLTGGERMQIESGDHAEIRTQEEKDVLDEHDSGYLSEIEKLLKYTITHEFGHSILSYDSLDKEVRFDSMCGSVDKTQKEIRARVLELYNEYLTKYGSRFPPVNPKRKHIPPQAHTRKSEPTNFISEYAGWSEEEFIAECFVQAQLSPTPSIYAVKMMEILNQFFAWNYDPEQLERRRQFLEDVFNDSFVE